jgi:heterodisulfide reductase subunit C
MRSLSQNLGYFVDSEKGRQQLALKRTIGKMILETGYCLYRRWVTPEAHPEGGPIWKWTFDNVDDLYERLGCNLDGEGTGVLRKIPQESLDELQRIFEVTGAMDRFEKLETYSAKKAEEMGLSIDDYIAKSYFGEK